MARKHYPKGCNMRGIFLHQRSLRAIGFSIDSSINGRRSQVCRLAEEPLGGGRLGQEEQTDYLYTSLNNPIQVYCMLGTPVPGIAMNPKWCSCCYQASVYPRSALR